MKKETDAIEFLEKHLIQKKQEEIREVIWKLLDDYNKDNGNPAVDWAFILQHRLAEKGAVRKVGGELCDCRHSYDEHYNGEGACGYCACTWYHPSYVAVRHKGGDMKPPEKPIVFVDSPSREGIEDILDKADIGDFDRWVWSLVASDILRYLHSQGVVIKVDKELPLSDYYFEDEAYETGQDDMLKAGYVAVEPIIGDK